MHQFLERLHEALEGTFWITIYPLTIHLAVSDNGEWLRRDQDMLSREGSRQALRAPSTAPDPPADSRFDSDDKMTTDDVGAEPHSFTASFHPGSRHSHPSPAHHRALRF